MNLSPPRPSLKDIARETGVSVSLVSKVLNNRLGNTGVTEALAEKIRETADRIGYRKNLSAESLRSGRHNAVGVLIHRHGEAGSGLTENVMLGITGTARKNEQKLLLNFFEQDAEFIHMSKSAHWGMMDGLIVGGTLHPGLKDTLLSIQEQGVPVVTIFNTPMHPDLLNVGMDQSRVTEIATLHLLDRGCRNIGTLASHPDRTAGVKRALASRGLELAPGAVYEAGEMNFTYPSGEEAVAFWLDSGTLPDGIVGESDAQAMGVINRLRKEGISVPGDVRVTGVDNSPFCSYVRPTITSVLQQYEQRGRLAMDMILNLLNGEAVSPVEIEPELFIRGSS